MSPLFFDLLESTRSRLEGTGFVSCPVPAPFAHQKSAGGVDLSSYWLQHPEGTAMKCAYLLGARIEILNVMIYPQQAEAVPIFACEYIAMGRRPFVAVVDLQPAIPGSRLLGEIVSALTPVCPGPADGLTPGGALPEWARATFTSACVYARPLSLDELPLLQRAYADYLSVWLRFFSARPRSGALPTGQADLAHYQAHHIEHTPGRPFLSKTFGAEWTEAYLRDFMYAGESSAPGGPQSALAASLPSPALALT